ncbi:MAG: hypothetical protein ACUVUG_02200 [Candidatus Aminicenantia bacterium]
MKELKLKSVDVVKLALVMAVFYLIVSFIVLLLIFLVGRAFIPMGTYALPFAGLGFALVILGPIIYSIIAFIVTLIVGLLLNLSLSIAGGLPLRFEE